MSKLFLFDVDGTLTGYRREMSAKHQSVFEKIAARYPVYLITGSDLAKTRSQVPQKSLDMIRGLYTCSGCELWHGDNLVKQMGYEFPKELQDFLNSKIDESPYAVRAGKHIESRTGSLNFSIVGRNASRAQRDHYYAYDKITNERDSLVEQITEAFPQFDVFRGGQISVDITPKGWNKAQCLDELVALYPESEIHFFGDNMGLGGNDRPLAQAVLSSLTPGFTYPVSGPEETFEILESLVSEEKREMVPSYFSPFVRSNLSTALA